MVLWYCYYHYYYFNCTFLRELKSEILCKVQPAASKLSCNKTVLKRYTGTYTLLNKKAPSLSLPEVEEIFFPSLAKNGQTVISFRCKGAVAMVPRIYSDNTSWSHAVTMQ